MDSVLVLRQTWIKVLNIRINAIDVIKQLLIDAGIDPQHKGTVNWLLKVATEIFDGKEIKMNRIDFSESLQNAKTDPNISYEQRTEQAILKLQQSGFVVITSSRYECRWDLWPQDERLIPYIIIRLPQ